jgi:tRNA1(Val) A37 N6-methylase TrmN6
MGENPEIHVLDHKVRLFQPQNGFRTSLDSVFLASACKAQAGEKVLDMGTGVGGAAFCLLWRVTGCYVTGVEIQRSHAELAIKNIALNNAEGYADFVCADIRDYAPNERFDHVICNPPYLEAGSYTPSPLEEKAKALGHEGSDVSLNDWIDAAFRNLKSGGSITMIHRADYADKIIQGLGRKFGAIDIIPLYPRVGEDAKRVIIRAIKDRKTPARLMAGIVLHEADGSYTQAADAILRTGAAIGSALP